MFNLSGPTIKLSGGVVDSDRCVFGVDNLYVAGGSILPTAGFANPTLTIVALAARLARHLQDRLRWHVARPASSTRKGRAKQAHCSYDRAGAPGIAAAMTRRLEAGRPPTVHDPMRGGIAPSSTILAARGMRRFPARMIVTLRNSRLRRPPTSARQGPRAECVPGYAAARSGARGAP